MLKVCPDCKMAVVKLPRGKGRQDLYACKTCGGVFKETDLKEVTEELDDWKK